MDLGGAPILHESQVEVKQGNVGQPAFRLSGFVIDRNGHRSESNGDEFCSSHGRAQENCTIRAVATFVGPKRLK